MKPFDMDGAALAAAQLHAFQADIEFARDPGGGTYVRRQRVGYPFHLGRLLFTPGDPSGMPTVYLQSCAGGIFEGDDLGTRIEAGAGTSAHVTSGASTIVHSMTGAAAGQRVELCVREQAFLEYLPDPNILFPHSRLENRVAVTLHPGATAIVGDALLLHDPKGGGGVFDWLHSETRIEDAQGRLLVCDRFRIEGRDLLRGLAGVAGASTAQGSLFIVTAGMPATEIVGVLREALDVPGVYAGAALLPNQAGAWARMLAVDAAALKTAMFKAWSAARATLTGSTPMQRRK